MVERVELEKVQEEIGGKGDGVEQADGKRAALGRRPCEGTTAILAWVAIGLEVETLPRARREGVRRPQGHERVGGIH